MTDHNKDKSFRVTDYLDLVDLIGLLSKLPILELSIQDDLGNSP